MEPNLFELLRTLETQIDAGSSAFRFRIEVFGDSKTSRYYSRISRAETFRIQPAFPQKNGEPNPDNLTDCEIYVLDDFLNGFDNRAATLEGSIAKVEAIFRDVFGSKAV